MALIQGLLAGITRSAGKVLNTAFSWATVMLFGKVSKDRQIYLSGIAFGSVIWLVVLIGIAFPAFATWLLAFVRLPHWVSHNVVRLVMLGAAVVIPLIVGLLSTRVADEAQRGSALRAVIRGYPYCLGMAVTLVMLTIFAPVMKLRSLARRWTTQHVPVLVEAPDYLEVVGDVQSALEKEGRPSRRQPATWMLRLPTRVLSLLAGSGVKSIVAAELTTLVSPDYEVMLHPSDLVIAAKEADSAHIRAVIAQKLAFSKAHLTWDKEAEGMEDRLTAIWHGLNDSHTLFVPEALAKLEVFGTDLKRLDIPYDEWEVLFRARMQVEAAVLRLAAGYEERPQVPTKPGEKGAGTAPAPMLQTPAGARRAPRVLPRAAAVTAAAAAAWLGLKRAYRARG